MRTGNKYEYVSVIQQNFGCGFEDVSEYETDSRGRCFECVSVPAKRGNRLVSVSLLRHDFREYKMLGYPTRVVKRRILK